MMTYRLPYFTRIFSLLLLTILSGQMAIGQSKTKEPKKKKGETSVSEGKSALDAEFAEYYGNAATQKMLGNYAEAVLLFSRCITRNEKIAAPYYEIADIYYKQGQVKFAEEYAKTAVKLDGTNKWYYLLLSNIYIEEKRYKDAQETYETLVKKFPDEKEYALDLGDLYLIQRKYKDAIEIYNGLEKKTGISPELSLQKQKVYQAMGKMQDGIKEIQNLIKAFPGEPEYYGILAEIYLSMNKMDEALKAYQQVEKLRPDNPVINLALANFYQEQGQLDKAFQYLKKAFQNGDVAIDDKIKILLSYFEISVSSDRRKREADTLLDVMKVVHGDDPKTWSIIGDFYMQDENYPAARSAFKKVVALESGKYIIWEQLMQLDLSLQEYDDLLLHATEAAEIFPSQPSVYYYKGVAESESGAYADAISSLTMARDLTLDNPQMTLQIKLGLADAYRLNGEFPKSKEILEKLYQQFPNNALVMNSYAYALSLMNEDLAKAKEMIEKAMKLSPANVAFMDTYAWVYYHEGNYTAALNQIEKAISLGGDRDPEITEHYGDILFKNGKAEMALIQWKIAKSLSKKPSKSLEEKIELQKIIE